MIHREKESIFVCCVGPVEVFCRATLHYMLFAQENDDNDDDEMMMAGFHPDHAIKETTNTEGWQIYNFSVFSET